MTRTLSRSKVKPKPKKKLGLVRVRLDQIRPSPENAELYRPVDPNEPDVRALAESIHEKGILDPLVITEEHVP